MKIIKQFPQYGITEEGQVYSFKTKKYLKVGYCRGYAYLSLMKDGVKRMVRRARLVVEAFNGKIPKGYTVDHLNGNKADDRLINLEVCTLRQNIARYWRQQV